MVCQPPACPAAGRAAGPPDGSVTDDYRNEPLSLDSAILYFFGGGGHLQPRRTLLTQNTSKDAVPRTQGCAFWSRKKLKFRPTFSRKSPFWGRGIRFRCDGDDISLLSMYVTGYEHDKEPVSSSSGTADAWLTSSRPDNGCYGRQLLKPNSLAYPQLSITEAGTAINCHVRRVPRWPGIDTLIVAYQRYVHGKTFSNQ